MNKNVIAIVHSEMVKLGFGLASLTWFCCCHCGVIV